MTDTRFIDDLIEAQEQSNQNLQAIAAELDLSKRDLVTGASPAEKVKQAEKAALFSDKTASELLEVSSGGGSDEGSVLAEGIKEKAETAAALVEQNAANIVRIAEAAGVSKSEIEGDAATSDLDEQKVAAFAPSATTGGDAEKADMTTEEKKKAIFTKGKDPYGPAEGWESDGERNTDPRGHYAAAI